MTSRSRASASTHHSRPAAPPSMASHHSRSGPPPSIARSSTMYSRQPHGGNIQAWAARTYPAPSMAPSHISSARQTSAYDPGPSLSERGGHAYYSSSGRTESLASGYNLPSGSTRSYRPPLYPPSQLDSQGRYRGQHCPTEYRMYAPTRRAPTPAPRQVSRYVVQKASGIRIYIDQTGLSIDTVAGRVEIVIRPGYMMDGEGQVVKEPGLGGLKARAKDKTGRFLRV